MKLGAIRAIVADAIAWSAKRTAQRRQNGASAWASKDVEHVDRYCAPGVTL